MSRNTIFRSFRFLLLWATKTYTSRVDFDNEQFYELMAQYDEIPKTSQITPVQFQEIYLQQAKAGVTDLILVLINSKGSSTYENSVQAIDLFYAVPAHAGRRKIRQESQTAG